jgi:hypothetical protein
LVPDQDAPARRDLQAQQEVGGGRLPRTGLADDRDGLPAGDVERHVVDGQDVVSRAAPAPAQREPLADALESHQRLGSDGVLRSPTDVANGVKTRRGGEQPSRVCVFGLS